MKGSLRFAPDCVSKIALDKKEISNIVFTYLSQLRVSSAKSQVTCKKLWFYMLEFRVIATVQHNEEKRFVFARLKTSDIIF